MRICDFVSYDRHSILVKVESRKSLSVYRKIFNDFLIELNSNEKCDFFFKFGTKEYIGYLLVFISNKNIYNYLVNFKDKIRDWSSIRIQSRETSVFPKYNGRNLKIERLGVKPLDDKLMSNILRCKGDSFIELNEQKLFEIFSPFADDSKTVQTRFVKNTKIEKPYPFISLDDSNKNNVFITFDPNRADAQFANLFIKNITLASENIILKVTHSFRTKRDDIALQ